MHDRTKKNLYRSALLSLRRLQKQFQQLREDGKVSVEAAQCLSDALSCLRRSHDLYKLEVGEPAPALPRPSKRIAARAKPRR
jgi:hypothetical protein